MIEVVGRPVVDVVEDIIEALIKQGTRCVRANTDICLYDDGNGKHCAVGFIVPPEWDVSDIDSDVAEMIDLIEETRIDAVQRSETTDILDWMRDHLEVLLCLQMIHDYDESADSSIVDIRITHLGHLLDRPLPRLTEWREMLVTRLQSPL